MIVDCISDLHGSYPELEGGDLLIVAGDLTARDTWKQHQEFQAWLIGQKYTKKVLIAGNHDGQYEKTVPFYTFETGICYLQDSGTQFEGLNIWGSPWTPEFSNWHFMLPRGLKLKEKRDLIPDNTDILVTHGPPHGILDTTDNTWDSERLGCEDLREAVERVKPRLHVFGHIHGGYGKMVLKHAGPNTICVNAAIMDENYKPMNKPIRVIL